MVVPDDVRVDCQDHNPGQYGVCTALFGQEGRGPVLSRPHASMLAIEQMPYCDISGESYFQSIFLEHKSKGVLQVHQSLIHLGVNDFC